MIRKNGNYFCDEIMRQNKEIKWLRRFHLNASRSNGDFSKAPARHHPRAVDKPTCGFGASAIRGAL
jgi:hypothetical protein